MPAFSAHFVQGGLRFLPEFRTIARRRGICSIVVEVSVNANELLKANQLSAAIADLTQNVKSRPSDNRLRTFLFELLCFAGEYERAELQLNVIGHQDEKTGIGIEIYRQLLKAEAARQRWFSEGLKPSFLVAPTSSSEVLLEGGNRLRGQQIGEATALLQQACQTSSGLSGLLNGKPFSGFRDSDDRVGPVLELFMREQYMWLPYVQIKKITIPQPQKLRDLLWTQASLEVEDGSTGEVFLPVLYAGSHRESNDEIRLGRITEWRGLGDGLTGGVGQKTFLTDDREVSILEIREIEFHRA